MLIITLILNLFLFKSFAWPLLEFALTTNVLQTLFPQVGKDRHLDYDPCTVSYMNDGTYLVVGGSDKAVTLHTKEGVKLLPILADAGNWYVEPRHVFQPSVKHP